MSNNSFYVAPPDTSGFLKSLMGGYEVARGVGRNRNQDEARMQAAEALRSGGDPRGALAALIGAGDVQGANALSNFGDQDFNRNYKAEMLRLAQQGATRREEPEAVRTLRSTGIDPRSPQGQKMLFPKTDTPVSATDKKAIFEAEDAIPQLQGTMEALARAQELNNNTFSGAGAGARAWAGSNLPDLMVPDFLADKKTADATTEWQKIMGPEALQTMANTLKGATTDFELRKFIEMLGDPATPPKVRASVIQRMQTLAQRKMELNQSRMKDLRSGTYFKPEGGQPRQGGNDPLAQARDAIARGADRNAVMQRLQQNGIDPSGL